VLPRFRGALTRSSIRPRLLFPPGQLAGPTQQQPNTHDEEAITDIEEARTPTPVAQLEFSTSPPGAPRFGNLSPSTQDARFAEVPNESKRGRLPSPTESTDEPPSPDSPSPSNGRRRTKTSTEGKGKKREGDLIAKGESKTSKRRRHASRT
jgi:hypothetical protein